MTTESCWVDGMATLHLHDNIMNLLPNEILKGIFALIPLRDKLVSSLVCRRWKALIDELLIQQESLFICSGSCNLCDQFHSVGVVPSNPKLRLQNLTICEDQDVNTQRLKLLIENSKETLSKLVWRAEYCSPCYDWDLPNLKYLDATGLSACEVELLLLSTKHLEVLHAPTHFEHWICLPPTIKEFYVDYDFIPTLNSESFSPSVQENLEVLVLKDVIVLNGNWSFPNLRHLRISLIEDESIVELGQLLQKSTKLRSLEITIHAPSQSFLDFCRCLVSLERFVVTVYGRKLSDAEIEATRNVCSNFERNEK